MSVRELDALTYHEEGRPGKLEVVPTKPCLTARDLSLAYSPGVAQPCLAIERDPKLAYRYTNRGNLVAVVSNGTAVLGLGDIGALAGKPVMEGKAVLFKRFAQVDVFDIELDTKDPAEIVRACQILAPTFGGINLEDIKAPECFEVEEALRESLTIPVFHDDQHGTAIISGAALLNALELVGKEVSKVKVVVSGAGASALACARFFEELGVPLENFLLADSKGVIYEGRTEGMNRYKARYAQPTDARTLAHAMVGADVFLGCSAAGLVTPEMLQAMADRPIVFALANPDPEISYDDAKAARPDAIVATGRSDYPNQVNNVLGFPFIFRGALDVRATRINEAMKVAAARSLAELAKAPVPEEVRMAYGGQEFSFGPDYIIPKPFDPRLLVTESLAVAQAACQSGVATEPIEDWDAYRLRLEARLSRSEILMQRIRSVARRNPPRIVFSEGASQRVLEACRVVLEDGTGKPILLGDPEVVREKALASGLDLAHVEMVDPRESGHVDAFAERLLEAKWREGWTPRKARQAVASPVRYGMMMLRLGLADAMVSGADSPYIDTLRTVISMGDLAPGVRRVYGYNLLLAEGKVFVLGDTSLNIEPDAEQLAEIARTGAALARDLGLEPKVAMLSFSNFGDSNHPRARKMRAATAHLRRECPDLVVDGEMHGDVALMPAFAGAGYPLSRIQGDANVLIFPDLDSANISLKLLAGIGSGREVVGPILEGLLHPVNVASYNSTAREIASLASYCCYRAASRG